MRESMAGCVLFLLVSLHESFGKGNPEFDVRTIPGGLRADAPVVIRESAVTFVVQGAGEAEESGVIAYTIFNKDGRRFGYFSRPYGRYLKIKDLDGLIYDASGEEIRSLGSDDILDESDISSSSLYEDSRIRTAELYHDQYPYTVVYRWRVKHTGILAYPSWVAQPSSEPVVHTRLELVMPEGASPRYWASPGSPAPSITSLNEQKHYVWEASRLRELSDEEMEEDLEYRTVVVRTAPMEFELEGRKGVMNDWRSLGMWFAALFKGKQVLSQETASDVRAITEGMTSDRDKVERIYRYMQERTRYVNVSLGIGSWEPYDAEYVCKRGYGDCKALSNFTIALLGEAGITSYPVLIEAGGSRSSVIEEFPSHRFNHVILCVPLARDSLWLECTSQDIPCGHLGASVENRLALLLTPAGGVLVHTPPSTPSGNLLARSAQLDLSTVGDAKGAISIRRSGNRAENVRSVLLHGSPDIRERWFLGEVAASGTRLLGARFEGVNEKAREVVQHIDFYVTRLASVSGSRMFLRPNLADDRPVVPKDYAHRKSPLRIPFPYMETDSVFIRLPQRTRCEALPSAVKLETGFGLYSSSTAAFGDTMLLYTRTIEIRKYEVPAEGYPEYVTFLKGITKAERQQIVLLRR